MPPMLSGQDSESAHTQPAATLAPMPHHHKHGDAPRLKLIGKPCHARKASRSGDIACSDAIVCWLRLRHSGYCSRRSSSFNFCRVNDLWLVGNSTPCKSSSHGIRASKAHQFRLPARRHACVVKAPEFRHVPSQSCATGQGTNTRASDTRKPRFWDPIASTESATRRPLSDATQHDRAEHHRPNSINRYTKLQ